MKSPPKILNDKFIVKYDEKLQSILIIHPDEKQVSNPLVRIKAETLVKMNFLEASQFLGERRANKRGQVLNLEFSSFKT